jgi:hypothetical protein
MRAQPVRAARHFELKHAQLDPNLQDHPSIPGTNLPRQDLARLGIIRPTLDYIIQVPPHRLLPTRRGERATILTGLGTAE